MKIIRLTTLLDFGGQERQYISFVEDSNMFQNEYVFAAIGHGGYAEKFISEKGFEVKIFNSNPSISNLKNLWILYKWIKKINPDIVHTAAAEANFHGVIAAKLAGVKNIVAEEIGFPNHSSKAKLVFKFIYKFTKKVVCVSNSVKCFLIKLNEIDADKGYVIYNPVSKIKQVQRELSNEFTIVSVGRFEKIKNQGLLINAFSKIEDKSSKLILVGDGREKEELQRLVSDLNINDRVIFTGFVSDPETYIAKANLFVLPSLSEGFGIAVVEAMQQEVACLCTNVGGIPEFITDNETGWLFDPTNENMLVAKLNDIMSLSITDIDSVGKKGKEFVDNRFSTEKYIQNLEKFYQELHD